METFPPSPNARLGCSPEQRATRASSEQASDQPMVLLVAGNSLPAWFHIRGGCWYREWYPETHRCRCHMKRRLYLLHRSRCRPRRGSQLGYRSPRHRRCWRWGHPRDAPALARVRLRAAATPVGGVPIAIPVCGSSIPVTVLKL